MKNRLRVAASILVTAAFAAGCANMQGLTTRARPEHADRLATAKSIARTPVSASAWPSTDWWRRFNDPQLDKLMDEALAGSPTLRVAEARAREALAYAQVLKAPLYPRATGSAAYTRERFPEHGLIPPPFAGAWATQAQLQGTLDYELDLWGKNRAAYDSALGRAKAAEIDVYAARLALSVNIAHAYVGLENAYLQRDVAERALKQREQIYALTRDRFEAGIDSRLAVKQAEAALPATRERIAQLDETIGLLRNEIAALLGQGPDRGLAIHQPAARAMGPVTIPSALPAELIGRRPDIVAQRWLVEAARKDIAVAKAQFYPNVDLAAFVGLQSIGLPGFLEAGSRTLGAGPALTLPIFNTIRLRGNLAGRDAAYDAAVELYNEKLVDALRDVVDQLTSFRSLAEQRRQQRLAQATAQDAYDLALLRYRAGTSNYLEVLTAESQLLTQESLAADLHTRALDLTINLVRALGGGFRSDAPAPAHATGASN